MNRRYKLNYKIKYNQLRVITEDGENLGVLSKDEALKKAKEMDMDLVLLVEKANPPVAKILDFNKFLYEENKKASSIKAKSKKSELKEFRFGPTIGEADISNRIQRARKFIQDGNRVKVTIRMRGRENLHPEIGMQKIERFVTELEDVAKTEQDPKHMGNLITVTFVNK